MADEKNQKFQIIARVKIGSDFYFPEDGEALFLDLPSGLGQSLVEQGAALIVVEKKAALPKLEDHKK